MAKKRIIKDYPRLDKKLENFPEVEAYLLKLSKSMNEFRPRLFQGDVFVESRMPTDADGKDGDVWVQIL